MGYNFLCSPSEIPKRSSPASNGFARQRPFPPTPHPVSPNSAHSATPRGTSSGLLVLPRRVRDQIPSRHYPLITGHRSVRFARVHTRFIPRNSRLLCFHTLAHSFALHKTLPPAFSIISALLPQNTRGMGTLSQPLRVISSLLLLPLLPDYHLTITALF